MKQETQPLTQIEINGDNYIKGEKIVKALGYKEYAYTSTSALWGFFCMDRIKPNGCLILTKELGFLFVSDGEDNRLGYNWEDVV